MAYNPTIWNENTAPPISATNLNKIENKLDEIDNDLLKLQSDGYYITSTSYINVASIESTKNVVDVEISLSKILRDITESPTDYVSSERYQLQTNASQSAPGVIMMQVPGLTSTTRYFTNYYFVESGGFKRLYVRLASSLTGHSVLTKWIYKE